MSFMNSVDLRFKELQDPKIELNIAGVIIAKVIHTVLCVKFIVRKDTLSCTFELL